MLECTLLLKDRLKTIKIKEPTVDEVMMEDTYYNAESEVERDYYREEEISFVERYHEDNTDEDEYEDFEDDTFTYEEEPNPREVIARGSGDLFWKLRHFKNLQEEYVEKKCGSIFELIETITRGCPSLQQSHLKPIPTPNTSFQLLGHPRDRNSGTAIFDFKPAPNVNYLKFTGPLFKDIPLVNYIRKKFTHLETLEVIDEDKSSNPTTYMDKSTFAKLLYYLSQIKNVKTSNIPCTDELMRNAAAPLWRHINQLLYVSIQYNEYFTNRAMFTIRNGICTNNFILAPNLADSSLKIARTIQKYGMYIHQLSLSQVPIHSQSAFQLLVLQPLKYCSKLNTLSIHGMDLAESNIEGYGVIKKPRFGTLRLFYDDVTDESQFFERLSQLFEYIKNLHLEYSRKPSVNDSDKKIITYADINMTGTRIGNLSFTTYSRYFGHHEKCKDEVVIVRLTVDHSHSYYKCDLSNCSELYKTHTAFKLISKEEYENELNLGNRALIVVICKSLRSLNIKYFSHYMFLKV